MEQEIADHLYRHCTSENIDQQAGKLVSIVGKVTSVQPENSSISLEITPEASYCLTVIVPEFSVDFMLGEVDLNSLKDKEDLLLAEKYIGKCQSSGASRVVESENGPASLTWFTVEKSDLPSKDSPEGKNAAPPVTLSKQISAGSFSLNQYIEVRGRCIDGKTVEMKEYTDFEDSYDLRAHNNALNIGFKHCKDLLL